MSEQPTPEPSQPAAAPASAAKPAAAAARPTAAAAKPAAEAAAKPAASAPKPAAPKKGEASPNAPRPGVVFGGITSLKVNSIVVPFEHKVATGETLERIATQYYGSKAKASVLREANPALAAGQPVAGQMIKVPQG